MRNTNDIGEVRPVIREVAIRVEVEEGDAIASVMTTLAQGIAHLLGNEAMVFPVHVMALAANGSGYLIRYSARDGKEPTFLAEYEEGHEMMLPIHALLMDHNGYTARIILAEKQNRN